MAVTHNLSADECPVTWCTETGLHERHQQTLDTQHGQTARPPHQGMTLQLVIHGTGEDDLRPVIALLDPTTRTLDERTCELTWEQLIRHVAQAVAAITRFRGLA